MAHVGKLVGNGQLSVSISHRHRAKNIIFTLILTD